MGRIVVSENISLDGVIDDPMGVDGFEHGGWFGEVTDKDREAWAEFGLEEALASEAMLLGRHSYEFLEERWPSRTGEWADRLNSYPKYVVSSTLTDPAWNNTTVLSGDLLDDVATVKASVDGDVVVAASGQLVRGLLQHGLVDELRLMVFPFLLGGRHSLFRESGDKSPLRILDSRRIGESLNLLTYELVRDDGPAS
jgi:dihydrofolate reductase